MALPQGTSSSAPQQQTTTTTSTPTAMDNVPHENRVPEKSNSWFMSLSRRRKSVPNKEQNPNLCATTSSSSRSLTTMQVDPGTTTTTTPPIPSATTTTTATASTTTLSEQTMQSNNNCGAGGGGGGGSGVSSIRRNLTNKSNNSNILHVLGKCLKLKFKSKNDLFSSTSQSSSSSRRINGDRYGNSILIGSSPYHNHQNIAICNEYVEVPMPGVATTTTASSLPQSGSTNTEPLSLTFGIDVATNTDEAWPVNNQPTWWKSLSAADMTMFQAKIAMNKYCWYRGSMSRDIAQKKLQGQRNGSFLIRDSQTQGNHFTLSFRSAGITLHCRIENNDGDWIIESCRFKSMVGLIEHARQLSRNEIFCFVKPSNQLQQPFPVRLINPISKFDEVPSLQHICRYVIRRHIDADNLNHLPTKLQEYVNQNSFLGKEVCYFEI